MFGCRISFRYSTNGLPAITRSGIVENVTDTHVLLRMLDGSPSKAGRGVAYRQFVKSKMQETVIVGQDGKVTQARQFA